MTGTLPTFGSDEFVEAISRSATAESSEIRLTVAPRDMEVWAYALRELALTTDPEVVPAGMCDRAKTLLIGMAAAAGVAYQPLAEHSDEQGTARTTGAPGVG
jgi:hypothetical protein